MGNENDDLKPITRYELSKNPYGCVGRNYHTPNGDETACLRCDRPYAKYESTSWKNSHPETDPPVEYTETIEYLEWDENIDPVDPQEEEDYKYDRRNEIGARQRKDSTDSY